MGGHNRHHWAPVATLMSGGGRGSWFMPERGDEVLVAFDRGHVDFPYIVGYLWNGANRPPSTDPQLRLMRSVNGHEIAMYDPGVSGGDAGYIRIKDAHGNMVELSNAQVVITSRASITLTAPTVTINGRLVAPTSGTL
jgi:uncharacterized protein involved in type VI secretion and phage assembly